jgi:threonine dehydrogenase-like Zn-dependent dehydrogenase
MKYLVAAGPKKCILKEAEIPHPNDDQVLIQIKYVGVCMSEHYGWIHAKEGDLFGHEPMGIIAEVGKNVTEYKVGDRVSGMWGGTLPGAGGLVQYAVADPKTELILKLPDNVRDEDLILEPLSCMFSAVSKARIPMPGTQVCVVGCGYMGCGAISLLKLRGAYVTAVDIRPESLENAKKYGADEVYSVEEAKKLFVDSDFPGFEVVMEWGEGDDSLDLAVNLTRECGQLCVADFHTGEKRRVDMEQLGVKAIELKNTHPREWDLSVAGAKNAVRMLADGRWIYHDMPVKVYPLNKFDQAHEELETKYGKYMKAIIDVTKEDGEPYII